ncbi:MAG: glycosyltransferase family 4 protein [Acidimicrobiales bacterium]
MSSRRRSVFVLKSQRYGSSLRPLPYRIDLLGDAGYDVGWTDEHLSGPLTTGRLGRLAARTEALATPWRQALASRRRRRDADVTLAIFESEGHGVAAAGRLARLPFRSTRRPLVIVACWLADLARSGSPRRRKLYRWLYRGVDEVVVFSGNQADTLSSLLDIDRSKIAVVHFGVDLDELAAVPTGDSGRVVAAGRDLGRDWATLAEAARSSGWDVDLITRPAQIAGLDLPPEIHVAGVLDRAGYLEHLATAAVVVIPTEVREYPTGQTVLLEAMALGRACVVTDTPAMAEYVEHDRTVLLVPPHDPTALREAVDALLADPGRRRRLGDEAKRSANASGGAAAMWRDVAAVLDRAVESVGGREP